MVTIPGVWLAWWLLAFLCCEGCNVLPRCAIWQNVAANLHNVTSVLVNRTLIKKVCHIVLWVKDNLGQKYFAPQVLPDWGSNSCPPDHDVHIMSLPHYLRGLRVILNALALIG